MRLTSLYDVEVFRGTFRGVFIFSENLKSVVKTPVNLFKDLVLRASNKQKQAWSEVGSNKAFIPEQVDGCTDKHKELEPVLTWFKDFLTETLNKNIKGKGTVLDYGCGSGRYLKLLEENKNLELYGMDFSEPTLKNFTAKAAQRAHLISGDLTGKNPDFAIKFTEKFDGIYTIAVLQYVNISKLSNLLKNFKKTLKHQGILVLSFPIPSGPLDIFRYYHYTRYPVPYIEWVLKRLGFEIQFSGQTYSKERASWFYKDAKSNFGYWIVAKKT